MRIRPERLAVERPRGALSVRPERLGWMSPGLVLVAVEVEMVIPADDPSEPCYESETVQLLREIKEHAERGDVAWLTQKGKVYAAVETG